MVSLQHFKTLHSVQHHGGIVAAAKELNLSPSAVSQQIKALGSECGFPIVEPDGRGIRLTESGTQIARIGLQIEELWERSVARRRTAGENTRGHRRTVRLGAFPSAMAGCVLPAIATAKDPRLTLQLFETSPHEGRDQVEAGNLDVAVSIQEDGAGADARFGVVPLKHDPFVLTGPPGVMAAVNRSDPARALSQVPWVFPRVGSDCDRLISTHFARHGIAARPVGRTDDWALAQEMAATLKAVTCVPSSALVRRPDLVRLVTAGGMPAPARTLVLVAKPAALAAEWFTVLQQRLKRACSRTSGTAHTT
ncbi:LysR family transcriptional regulator [Streptomyces sp. TRM 70351]|uniref:LysR family transcriptional regulator n=1 Tax=Streptomyces sp. TRM 70351 TaxID=3116552 RepID=UPI002E7ABB79|nr:LysR family transcriptional regulator [Streptomyces sp. TRM 70351]MEE1930439.1 LysR family transcriptional regulator [Streptomyces sp. TRM 70351]